MRKRILSILVSVAALCLSGVVARGQSAGIVFDPTNMAASYSNSVAQIEEMLNQFGISADQFEMLEKLHGSMETVAYWADKAQTYKIVYENFVRLANNTSAGVTSIKNLSDNGILDPELALILSNNLVKNLSTGKRHVDTLVDLLADDKIPFAQKIQFERMYKEALASIEKENERIINEANSELLYTTIYGEWFDKLNADYSVDPYAKRDLGISFKGSLGIVWVVFVLLLGLLGVFITVQYMRGDYNSEHGFMRIFVALVFVAVLLAVLTSILSKTVSI